MQLRFVTHFHLLINVYTFNSIKTVSAGFIHETHTITEMLADVVTVSGLPTTEFCWFPGYAWRYVHCTYCGSHLGWKYLAEKPNLVPRNFFGLTGKSIRVESAQDAEPLDLNPDNE